MLKRIIGLGIVGDGRGHGRRGGHRQQPEAHPRPDDRPIGRRDRRGRHLRAARVPQHVAQLPGRPARMLVRRRRPRPARRGARARKVPRSRSARSSAAARSSSRPTGRSSRPSGAWAVSRTSARRRATPRMRPSSSSRGLLIAGGFAVSSELEDGGADFQADMEALRDNDELVLELDADPTPG